MSLRARCRLSGAACALVVAQAAWAHAFLERAVPAVGATVASAPTRVTLRFTQRLEGAFSRAQVLDERGARVDADDAAVARDDPAELAVSLKPLLPGRYTVKWRAVSADTHVTEGDFTFTLGP